MGLYSLRSSSANDVLHNQLFKKYKQIQNNISADYTWDSSLNSKSPTTAKQAFDGKRVPVHKKQAGIGIFCYTTALDMHRHWSVQCSLMYKN